MGSGIGTILLTLIPVLTSLLTKNKKMVKYSPKDNTYKEMYLINKFEKDIMENSLQNRRNDQTKTTQKIITTNDISPVKEKKETENSNKKNRIRKRKPKPNI